MTSWRINNVLDVRFYPLESLHGINVVKLTVINKMFGFDWIKPGFAS